MRSLALAYTDLPDIDETPPLDASDKLCMKEIRDLLARHNKLDRFGLTLLHQHFPVYEGEVLVETCNPETRELLMRTVPKSEVHEASLVETSWRLTNSEAMAKCQTECAKQQDGRHLQSAHYKRPA